MLNKRKLKRRHYRCTVRYRVFVEGKHHILHVIFCDDYYKRSWPR